MLAVASRGPIAAVGMISEACPAAGGPSIRENPNPADEPGRVGVWSVTERIGSMLHHHVAGPLRPR